jgi:hypothetical protein
VQIEVGNRGESGGVIRASQGRDTTQEVDDHMANVTVYTNIG